MDKSHVGMMQCYYCGEAYGIAIHTRMKKTLERQAIYSTEPCDKCKRYMGLGVILISIRDSTTDEEMKPKGDSPPNPYRTGWFAVVKDDFIKEAIKPESMVDWALNYRFLFITDSAWSALGLPYEDVDNRVKEYKGDGEDEDNQTPGDQENPEGA
jgi:hypothetical protein